MHDPKRKHVSTASRIHHHCDHAATAALGSFTRSHARLCFFTACTFIFTTEFLGAPIFVGSSRSEVFRLFHFTWLTVVGLVCSVTSAVRKHSMSTLDLAHHYGVRPVCWALDGVAGSAPPRRVLARQHRPFLLGAHRPGIPFVVQQHTALTLSPS